MTDTECPWDNAECRKSMIVAMGTGTLYFGDNPATWNASTRGVRVDSRGIQPPTITKCTLAFLAVDIIIIGQSNGEVKGFLFIYCGVMETGRQRLNI